jgi:hypothetical protein
MIRKLTVKLLLCKDKTKDEHAALIPDSYNLEAAIIYWAGSGRLATKRIVKTGFRGQKKAAPNQGAAL